MLWPWTCLGLNLPFFSPPLKATSPRRATWRVRQRANAQCFRDFFFLATALLAFVRLPFFGRGSQVVFCASSQLVCRACPVRAFEVEALVVALLFFLSERRPGPFLRTANRSQKNPKKSACDDARKEGNKKCLDQKSAATSARNLTGKKEIKNTKHILCCLQKERSVGVSIVV